MDLLDVAVLGIVEGITEFLPISSTGHLILTSTLLGIPTSEFLKSFEIAIQLGAISAVVLLYWRLFLDFSTLKKIFIGFLPTALIGLVLYSFIKTYLLGNTTVVLWALFLGGVALILFELLHKAPTPEGWGPDQSVGKKEIEKISYMQSFCVGVFQSIAIIPGVSRSAATILGGLLVGIPRTAIVQFSFLLAVPTMAAATGLDILKSAQLFSPSQTGMLAVGFITACIVALCSMKFLLHFVRTHTFIPFGVYRVVAAILFYIFIIL